MQTINYRTELPETSRPLPTKCTLENDGFHLGVIKAETNPVIQ